MRCPECSSERTFVVNDGRTRNMAVLERIRVFYPECKPRMRRCAACQERFFTIELKCEPPPAPSAPARVICGSGHYMDEKTLRPGRPAEEHCLRTGHFKATPSCKHRGARCKRHSCKSCIDTRLALRAS